MAGPLSGLSGDKPRPPSSPRGKRDLPDSNALSDNDLPERLVVTPFVVDYESRSVTQFGQPCLVPLKGKSRPLTPKEFNAAALLIAHMGQYVAVDTLCSHLQCAPAALQAIVKEVRRALGLGSAYKRRGSSLLLMSDGRPVRGYGIFIDPNGSDDYDTSDPPRGTRAALLFDLGAEAEPIELPSDEATLVVRFEEQTVRLHIGRINGPADPYVKVAPKALPSERADGMHDVLIGWDRSRGVYGIKRTGPSTYIGNALLGKAEASGIAYTLDSSADVERNVFTVESIFAAEPTHLATALRKHLEHQRSQAEGIPSNFTNDREAQAMIVERLGATRHGLLGVNPLPIYDLPAPFPPRALLYVDRILPHGRPGQLRIRPMLPGSKRGIATSFYHSDEIATLVLGLYEYEDTTLVVAWDPATSPMRNGVVLSVEEQTIRLAKGRNDLVSQSRRALELGHAEEVLAAPIEHLHKLIAARLRVPPRQRMIDALGGNSCVREQLGTHTWTMAIDGQRFHVQWCGLLLRGGSLPHILPFNIANRFVAPSPDAVALYAGHDPNNDVLVLWRHAPGQYMHADMDFSIPDSVIEEAARSGMAAHVAQLGQRRIAFRQAVAARYETGALSAALRHLSHEPNNRQMWRTRSDDLPEQLLEHLMLLESFDREQTRIRPWPATVELPTLGAQSLDIFAYRAQMAQTRRGFVAMTIQPFIRSIDGRSALFAPGREPVLIGECDGIYVLFDPRVRPTFPVGTRIVATVSPDAVQAIRKSGLKRMRRSHREGEFEETIIFATGERLIEALDLRLRTLARVNLERIRERVDMDDPQALADAAMRLQYAMQLPERDALTGSRAVPRKMIVITGAPKGIEVIGPEKEIRRALQTKRTADDAQLLWLQSADTERAVLLHAGLRAILQPGEAPRWPAPGQFDVLWALIQAAAHDGNVSDDLVQTACRNSLQWLFIGTRAPFVLHRNGQRDSYQVRLRHAVARGERPVTLAPKTLNFTFKHSRLYTAPKARPDIVWTFIKKVGPACMVPKGSADDVVFEVQGQRTWVYGLTNTLRRSEDGQTNYVTPALSQAQLSRIRSNPNDHHVLAAFDAERGHYSWVFWSSRPHLEQLHDPRYRLFVSASLPDGATEEWRQLDDTREERVVVYDASRYGTGITALLKRLAAELPQERVAAMEAQASESGLTLDQLLGVMKPADQIAIAMQYGLAPYGRRYRAVEIEDMLGARTPGFQAFQHAADLARASLEAGEPLPELAEIIDLLNDPRAEQYMGSRVLLAMLRELYGLGTDAKPASFAHVFNHYGLSTRVWHSAYRELIMHLIRGANRMGISTRASFGAGTADARVELTPTTSPPPQPSAANRQALEPGSGVARGELATAIALHDSDQLEASYAAATATLRRTRGVTWPSDVALPVALCELPPDVELVMRAYLGVWPYRHRYTAEQVTTEFKIDTLARSRLLISLASDELLAHAELMSGRLSPPISERTTLERLATLLIERGDVLAEDELNAVLVRHGLAATQPLVTEATRQGTISKFRPSVQYRRALQQLTGSVADGMPAEDNVPYWQPEQIDEIYKRIDAGEYAKLLLLLCDPATRDQTFADMVLRSVGAVGRRASHRSSAMQGRRRNTMEHRQTSLEYEEVITRVVSIDPDIETFLLRADKLDSILERALAITDEQVQWLQRVIDDGNVAYSEFLQGNIRLAYSAAIRAGYSEGRPESSEILVDAISGLQRAIWGYNPKMSFAFSNYAFLVTRSMILKRSVARYAQRLNVSLARAQEVIMTRVALARLREQAGDNEWQHELPFEQLAREVLTPLLRMRLVSRSKAEPSATQWRTGWRKYMPEFLRRMKENVKFVTTYDRIKRAGSLDRSLVYDSDDDFYNVVASTQQLAGALPGDEPDRAALTDDLKAALERAGLSEREQFILGHHFGIAGYTQLPRQEIAAREGISEDAVVEIIAAAAARIRESPEATALLMPYLRR